MRAVAEKKKTMTPVVIGFFVTKFWKDTNDRAKSKRVSRTFTARDAADDFKALASKSYVQNEDERDVYFSVTDEIGYDDIPKGV